MIGSQRIKNEERAMREEEDGGEEEDGQKGEKIKLTTSGKLCRMKQEKKIPASFRPTGVSGKGKFSRVINQAAV